MTLLLPLALLGLISIPIILVLHLLRNRREQLTISSLRLWRDLQQQRQGSRPRQIPLSLMLLLQLIAAIALTLGLARPALSFLLDQPQQTIFILDTSTSMAATDVPALPETPGQPARRFDVARQAIKDYVQAMGQGDTVAVISLSPRPEILLTGNAEQKASALTALDNFTPGATGTNLPAALALANSLVGPDRQNQIIILTDGTYSVDSQKLPRVLAPVNWQIIPNQPASDNLALLDVSSRRMPDGRHRLFARVVNYGSAPVERTLRLLVDGEPSLENTVQVDAQADAAKVWSLPAQAQTAAVEIVQPDPLPLDNRAELLLLGAARRQVLLVSANPDTLAKALQAQPGVDLTVRAPGQANVNPAEFDLTVFDSLPLELNAWPRGNLLVVNPPLGHPLLPAENFERDIRPNPESASPLLAGIDLSGVYFSRVPRVTVPEWATVDLESTAGEDGATLPLIFHGTVGGSRVAVWSFSLGASNLPARLALPLLTANTLTTLLAPSPLDTVPVGQPVLLAGNYGIELPDGRRLVPDSASTAGHVFSRTTQPGLYRIYSEGGAVVAGFAVHAGSPLESNLSQQIEPDTLTALDATAQPAPDIEIDYDEYWPWLAALALVVVTFEGWLAWRK